jgi:hypothetical protein
MQTRGESGGDAREDAQTGATRGATEEGGAVMGKGTKKKFFDELLAADNDRFKPVVTRPAGR